MDPNGRSFDGNSCTVLADCKVKVEQQAIVGVENLEKKNIEAKTRRDHSPRDFYTAGVSVFRHHETKLPPLNANVRRK